MNKYIITLLVATLLAGCATNKTTQQTTTTQPNTTVQSTPKATPSQHFNTEQLPTECNTWMKANLKIDFPNLSQNIAATIEIAKMDSILISINAMFGISVGKLFATPTEFVMNNNIDNITYIGTPTRQNMMQAAFIDLEYNDLISILKCMPTQHPANYAYNMADGSYTTNADRFTESLYFAGNDTLIKLVRSNATGHETLTVHYSKPVWKGQYLFASNITIKFNQPKGSIHISLADIQTSRPLTSPMRLAPPKSYKIINTDE